MKTGPVSLSRYAIIPRRTPHSDHPVPRRGPRPNNPTGVLRPQEHTGASASCTIKTTGLMRQWTGWDRHEHPVNPPTSPSCNDPDALTQELHQPAQLMMLTAAAIAIERIGNFGARSGTRTRTPRRKRDFRSSHATFPLFLQWLFCREIQGLIPRSGDKDS